MVKVLPTYMPNRLQQTTAWSQDFKVIPGSSIKGVLGIRSWMQDYKNVEPFPTLTEKVNLVTGLQVTCISKTHLTYPGNRIIGGLPPVSLVTLTS